MSVRPKLIAALGALMLTLPLSLPAQTPQPDNATERAARLSYLDGSVSVLPTGASEWSKAILNRPLAAGDHLWSDNASRAEIELGGAAVRLSSNSEVSLIELSDQGLQVGVGVGTINIALHSPNANEWFEIDTPQVAMSLQRDGDYRVTVDLDGTTTVLVRSGLTHLNNKSGEGISLRDGQGVVFASDGTLDVADARVADNFDQWCAQRNAQWQRENAQGSYVSDEVPGSQQLNDAGQWSDQPDMGQVWFPYQVPIGWAPFRSGRWIWTKPWGWTWIDKLPWGYAPFHYGHWVNVNGRWGWVPPSSHARPYFSAALVAAPGNLTTATAAAPLAHVGRPPPVIASRPIVVNRAPASMPGGLPGGLPRVVVATAPPHPTATAPVQYVSPIGPTIYARDVRPVERPASNIPTGIPANRDQLVQQSSKAPIAPAIREPMRTALAPENALNLQRVQHVPMAAPRVPAKPTSSSPPSHSVEPSKPAPTHSFAAH